MTILLSTKSSTHWQRYIIVSLNSSFSFFSRHGLLLACLLLCNRWLAHTLQSWWLTSTLSPALHVAIGRCHIGWNEITVRCVVLLVKHKLFCWLQGCTRFRVLSLLCELGVLSKRVVWLSWELLLTQASPSDLLDRVFIRAARAESLDFSRWLWPAKHVRFLTAIIYVTRAWHTIGHVILTLCLEGGVDDRVRHDRGVVREHPDLHLLGLVGPNRWNKRLDLATMHGVTIECEAELITQVTCHCLEIILNENMKTSVLNKETNFSCFVGLPWWS